MNQEGCGEIPQIGRSSQANEAACSAWCSLMEIVEIAKRKLVC